MPSREFRFPNSRALVWLLSALFLGACGSNNEGEPPSATAPVATNAAPTAPAPALTPPSEPVVETTEETAPVEEVSEVAESTETPATPSSTPTLKLASRGVDPKPPANSAFKEGQHYLRLVPTQPTSASAGQIEVIEIFWYGCPHCFTLDAKLENWRKGERGGKAAYVTFRRVPATWNEITTFHAKMFYTAELLGKLESLHAPLFRELHVNGNPLNTMDRVKAFFTAQGVVAADFDRTFGSFGVEREVQNANILMRRYKVPSVPFFVVNGKYTANVTSAGGEEQLLQLLNELAAREHGD